MNYQVLARKWRPTSFPELVGQAHVKSTLINALTLGRLHHAYLFTGTRGVGKTTIARIFAKSLNCEQGVTAHPCGQCDACQSIEQGRFVDLIEVDAASRTKVEDTREILDNVSYLPTQGRFKVYLIDEVHMLSRHSFNALLKTLEEPPEHVKFLLATTEPQKLPVTILSRCLQFNLKALSRSEIAHHLEHILSAETISFDQDSLKLLAKAADGSLRDALSLTDQAIAQANGGLNKSDVEQMLGTIDKQWSLKLLAHIVNNDATQAMATVTEIAQFMPNYVTLLDDLLGLFHLAAMTQLVPKVAQIDESQSAFVVRLAQKLSKQDVQLYYQLLLNGKKDLAYAPDPRMGFEMVLLRLLAFNPLPVSEQPTVSQVAAEPNDLLPISPISAESELAKKKLLTKPETKPEAKLATNPAEPIVSKPVNPVNPAKPDVSKPAQPIVEQQVQKPERQPTPQLTPQLIPQLTPQPQSQPTITSQTPALVADSEETLATLALQQDSVLQLADGLGFNPVESTKPTVEAQPTPIPTSTAAPSPAEPQFVPMDDYPGDISFSADDDDDTASYSFQEADYGDFNNAQTAQLSPPAPPAQLKPSVIKPVASPSDESFEDPVAAILANRNLALDNRFQVKTDADSAPEPTPVFTPASLPKSRPAKPESAEKPAKLENNPAKPAPMVAEPLTKPEIDLFSQPVAEVAVESTPKPVVETVKTVDTVAPVEIIAEPAEAVVTNVEPAKPERVNESGIPRWSAEVDEWAALIEKMQLGGRERIIAVHSVYKNEDKVITLLVANAQKHLASEGVHGQLLKALIRVLNQMVELAFEYTQELLQTPFVIQQDIDARRLVYAKQMVYQDSVVIGLQQRLAAQVDDSSIVPVD
ncbi:MAG: DNA polymerase-3 subunit gamma/tau [Phenylobacterium sp.]